jgi:hypothetical protein
VLRVLVYKVGFADVFVSSMPCPAHHARCDLRTQLQYLQ